MSRSRADSVWLCFYFFLLGHSTSLLGLQTGGAAQLLQTGRFTGKVTQAESPPFPPRALLEVSWVCQISWGHKTAVSRPLLEDNLANDNKIGHQSSSLITHKSKRPAQWWKPSSCFYGMLACVYRLNLHLEAVGTLLFFLLFNFLIQYSFLLCFDHPSKFEFFLWCYLACNSSLIFTASEQNCGFCCFGLFLTFSNFFPERM